MTLEQLYEVIGGDYQSVLGRLRKDVLIKKFALKFIDDKNFELLNQSIADNDLKNAFAAAHTLKGVCQNLNFDRLYKSSAALTEKLRAGEMDTALFDEVKKDYTDTIEGLKQLD